MILGKKKLELNWWQKLLKQKEELVKDSVNDNLLILGRYRNNIIPATTLLGALSTKLPVVYIERFNAAEEYLNDVINDNSLTNLEYKNKLNSYIKIDLDLIDFKKMSIINYEEIFSSLNLSIEEVNNSSFIHFYCSNKFNNNLFFDQIYSVFLKGFLEYYSSIKNQKYMLVIDSLNQCKNILSLIKELSNVKILLSNPEYFGNELIDSDNKIDIELANLFSLVKIYFPENHNLSINQKTELENYNSIYLSNHQEDRNIIDDLRLNKKITYSLNNSLLFERNLSNLDEKGFPRLIKALWIENKNFND